MENVNVSIVFGNYTNVVSELGWSEIIRNTCSNWKNYSTYSHDFYMKIVWLIILFSLMSIVYNPEIKYYKKLSEFSFLSAIGIDEIKIDIKIATWLKNIFIGALIMRIFQVYYIMKLYL